jgi:hypothetical protein
VLSAAGASHGRAVDMRLLKQKRLDLLSSLKKQATSEEKATWANPYVVSRPSGNLSRQCELFKAVINGDIAKCTSILQDLYRDIKQE